MNDFPDWLGPIIVKELRQGLRSKVFVSIFFLLQGAMIFCILMGLSAQHYNRDAANGLFWTLVGGILLVAMPVRGLGAISGEIKGNTLELLLLTQLSAWRVAMGKWVALFFQTLLLVCTLFPYVVLRYFLGGVDLTGELLNLGALLVGSALLMGITMAISPIAHRPLGRLLLGIISILGFMIIPQLIVDTFVRGRLGGVSPWVWGAFSLLLAPLFILLMLESVVGKIAPPGENIVWRKRLLALATVLISAGIAYAFNAWTLTVSLAALMVAPVCLSALLDKAPPIPSLYKPFRFLKNWPRLNGIAARFLQPGVAAGIPFTAVIILALLSLVGDGTQTVLLGIAAFIVPAAFVRMISRFQAFPAYLAIQFFGVALAILMGQLDRHSEKLAFSGFYPTTAFLLSWFKNLPDDGTLTFILGMVAFLSFLALFSLVVGAAFERRMIKRILLNEEATETPSLEPVAIAAKSPPMPPIP